MRITSSCRVGEDGEVGRNMAPLLPRTSLSRWHRKHCRRRTKIRLDPADVDVLLGVTDPEAHCISRLFNHFVGAAVFRREWWLYRIHPNIDEIERRYRFERWRS